jgi:hypothetical protein
MAVKRQPRASRTRACEYPRCRVTGLIEQMARFPSGEWYCPDHGLLLAAKDLVALYPVRADHGGAIFEILTELLPSLVTKSEAREERRPGGR